MDELARNDRREEIDAQVSAAAEHLRKAMEMCREIEEEDIAHALGISVAGLEHFREVSW